MENLRHTVAKIRILIPSFFKFQGPLQTLKVNLDDIKFQQQSDEFAECYTHFNVGSFSKNWNKWFHTRSIVKPPSSVPFTNRYPKEYTEGNIQSRLTWHVSKDMMVVWSNSELNSFPRTNPIIIMQLESLENHLRNIKWKKGSKFERIDHRFVFPPLLPESCWVRNDYLILSK